MRLLLFSSSMPLMWP